MNTRKENQYGSSIDYGKYGSKESTQTSIKEFGQHTALCNEVRDILELQYEG